METTKVDLSRFRVPLGSLAVDIALVIAVIYSAGQLTEKLDQISRRVESLEAQGIQIGADRRLAVVESRVNDMTVQLTQANQKLDALLMRRRE